MLRLIFFSFCVTLAGFSPAFAHGKMLTTIPADGTKVAIGLSKIALNFSKPMRITKLKILRNSNGSEQKSEVGLRNAVPKSFAQSFDIKVSPLEIGTYVVNWIAVAKDGHVMKGHFMFSAIAPSD